jgi:SPOR domain
MKLKFWIKIFLLFFLVMNNLDRVLAEQYSIQVKSFPLTEKENAYQLFNELKDAGLFVYMHKTKVDKQWWIRIKIGQFNSQNEADLFGKEIKEKLNLDYWVNKANILIDKNNTNFSVLTTPSGIWIEKNSTFEEVYSFPLNDTGVLLETKAMASSISDEIVFYFHQKLIKVDLKTKQPVILKEAEEIEGLNKSFPKWSYDSKYIAYMDSYTWEVSTKLWIMQNDGSNDTCIIKDLTNQMKVKDFSWHPSKNEIFYIYGPTHGAMDLGGKLYSIDLETMKIGMIAATENPYLIEKIKAERNGIILTIMKIEDAAPGIKRILKEIPFPEG